MTIFENLRFYLMLITAIGSAITGGIFYAFSTFVMKALSQQPVAGGIATMQSINITVLPLGKLDVVLFLDSSVREQLIYLIQRIVIKICSSALALFFQFRALNTIFRYFLINRNQSLSL
ncbi:MAG: hypothetical protein AAFV71_20795 [Cyanobacteria bacterium J06633_8]